MNIINISSNEISNDIWLDLELFCQKAQIDTNKQAAINMAYDNWENKPNTLLYLLKFDERFKKNNGFLSLLYDNNQIIACSGISLANFDRNIAIGGMRTWIHKEYRAQNLIVKHIRPIHLAWCVARLLKVYALTFNEYNLNLMQILNRAGKYSKYKNRQIFGSHNDEFYQNMTILDNTINLNNTKQYVMYHKFDKDYQIIWPLYETSNK